MAQFEYSHTVRTYIVIWILAPLLVLFTPIFLILCTPIYLFRFLVSWSSGIVRPDLGKIVNSADVVFATENIYYKPTSTLLIHLFVEGDVDVEAARRDFTAKAVQRTTAEGQLKHPELQQYVSTWLGFYFWKWEPDFQVENHIREYDGQVKYKYLTQETLHEISNELIEKAWTQQQSPWEILICPNYWPQNDETPGIRKTACLLRIHHILADGISIVKLFMTDIAEEKLNIAQPKYIQKSLPHRILDGLTFGFRLPYDVSSTLVKSNDPFHEFHKPHDQMSIRYNLATSSKIPLYAIKEIRDLYNGSFAGITLAAFSGALRTLMLENVGKVPDYISVNAPLPRPGHPDSLGNHVNSVIISLPVGVSDARMRLRIVESNLRRLKKSTYPVYKYWHNQAAGSLHPSLLRFSTNQSGPTATVTSIPGPNKQIRVFGQPLIDTTFSAGFGSGNVGIMLGSLSYNGNIRFMFGIDESILPSSERSLDGFMDNLLKELDVLKRQHQQAVV